MLLGPSVSEIVYDRIIFKLLNGRDLFYFADFWMILPSSKFKCKYDDGFISNHCVAATLLGWQGNKRIGQTSFYHLLSTLQRISKMGNWNAQSFANGLIYNINKDAANFAIFIP